MVKTVLAKLASPFKALWESIIEPSSRAKTRWALIFIVLLVLYSAAVVYPKGYNQIVASINAGLSTIPVVKNYQIDQRPEENFNLGLDLQGGAHLVYEAQTAQTQNNDTAEVLARLRDRIERRVNALGVSEPLVQVSGDERLVVELAGVDSGEAIDQIGETPTLEFREQSQGQQQRELTEEEQNEIDEFNAGQEEKATAAFERVTSGQEAFEDVAREVSEDTETKESGGDLGAITRVSHPQVFEGIGDTRIGRVVPEVIETDQAFEIVRVDDRQSDDVEMQVSHILLCYEGSRQCQSGLSRGDALSQIEEIASSVTPENFEERAKEHSTDPSVSQNGGDLGWVAPGTTVEPFQDAARELGVGEISEPVESDFGWHLIYKRDERPFEEVNVHHIQFEKRTEQDILPEPSNWKNTGLTGENVVDAQLVFAPQTNAPQVSIQFDEEGTRRFEELTSRYQGQQIAIFLDGNMISNPTVQQVISNGEAVISGNFTTDSAQNLARGLKDGALPVPIELVQQKTVGASLGADALDRSLRAGGIGVILIAVFMLLYYRLLGVLAIIALGIYGLIALMAFKHLGVTITLSGIAGFVLSVGMAVDANVLIFERFREERARGRDLYEAIQYAFERAWPSIRDGNVSTLITCFILGWFGTSLIQGFAVTLALGILVSMFTAIVITRVLMEFTLGWPFVRKLTPLLGSGWRLKG